MLSQSRVHRVNLLPKCWNDLRGSMIKSSLLVIPYFFGYKKEFFSFQNNPKDLDPSCKTDLDLWDCLGRVKLVL